MTLPATLSNITVQNNNMDQSIIGASTYTYDIHMNVLGNSTAFINILNNKLAHPTATADMMFLNSASAFIQGNIFIRDTTTIESYIRNSGSLDQIFGYNTFDKTTVDGSSTALTLGLTDNSFYSFSVNTNPLIEKTQAASFAGNIINNSDWSIFGVLQYFLQSTAQSAEIDCIMPVSDCRTIKSITVYYVLASTSRSPASPLNVTILKQNIVTGAHSFPLNGVGVTYGIYNTYTSTTFTLNEPIDKSQYFYFITVIDESGAGAISGGNKIYGYTINYL